MKTLPKALDTGHIRLDMDCNACGGDETELQATIGKNNRLYLLVWCESCGLHSHTIRRSKLHKAIEDAVAKLVSKAAKAAKKGGAK